MEINDYVLYTTYHLVSRIYVENFFLNKVFLIAHQNSERIICRQKIC